MPEDRGLIHTVFRQEPTHHVSVFQRHPRDIADAHDCSQ